MPINPDNSFSLKTAFGTGTSPGNQFPIQVGDDLNDIAGVLTTINQQLVKIATANVTFYVSTTGSDSNPGTLAAPFASTNHALVVVTEIDYQNQFFPTIQIEDGSYSFSHGGGTLPWLKNGSAFGPPDNPGPRVVGNRANPGNVLIWGFDSTDAGLNWTLGGFTIQGSGFGVLNLQMTGLVYIDDIIFSGSNTAILLAAQIVVFCGGGNGTITCTGVTGTFCWCAPGGEIQNVSSNLNFSNSQTFSSGVVVGHNEAVISLPPLLNKSNAHGARYVLSQYSSYDSQGITGRTSLAGDSVGQLDVTSNLTADTYHHVYTPTSGTTVTATAGETKSILNPVGTLATLTVNPPVEASTDESWSLSSSQTITALTLTTTDSSTIVGAPTTIPAGSGFTMIYNRPNTTWYISD